MNERDKAINILIKNVLKVSEENKKEILELNPVNKNLPGYIPYIGKEYFSDKIKGKRILIYALSQNIKQDSKFAEDWVKDWDVGLDRQNYAYYKKYEKEGKIGIEMHPFDTGHLPVIATMLLNQLKIQVDSICDFVSATNLSKFSFTNDDGTTRDNKKSLEKCFEWFSKREIEILSPDYIICAGNLVFDIITKKYSSNKTTIIKVIFPRLPQVVTKKLKNQNSPTIKKAEDISNMFSETDREKKVDYAEYNRNLKYVIERDWIYFSNMYSEIQEQLNTLKS